jgi:hypothetical protein
MRKSRSAGASPELKRLQAKLIAATKKRARALLDSGPSSPAVRKADDEVEAAAEGIKKILGKQLSAAQ